MKYTSILILMSFCIFFGIILGIQYEIYRSKAENNASIQPEIVKPIIEQELKQKLEPETIAVFNVMEDEPEKARAIADTGKKIDQTVTKVFQKLVVGLDD